MIHYRPVNNWVDYLTENFFERTVDDVLNDGFYSSFDANVFETPSSYELEIAVPGMTKKDLSLAIKDNVLHVTGNKNQKSQSVWGRKYVEFKSTELSRSFVLPEEADAKRIQAKCRDGMLKIHIPKLQFTKHHRIINIDGDTSASATMAGWSEKPMKIFGQLMQKIRDVFKFSKTLRVLR